MIIFETKLLSQETENALNAYNVTQNLFIW